MLTSTRTITGTKIHRAKHISDKSALIFVLYMNAGQRINHTSHLHPYK